MKNINAIVPSGTLVAQFMRIHMVVYLLSQKNLENLNNIMANNFWSSCHSKEALKQLTEKQNLIKHLRDEGNKRAKNLKLNAPIVANTERTDSLFTAPWSDLLLQPQRY